MTTRSGRPSLTARQRDTLHRDALRALVKAAAALDTFSDDGLALAILEAGIALHRLVQLDVNLVAYERVIASLQAVGTASDPG